MNLKIRELTDVERDRARGLLAGRWGSPVIVTCGTCHQADALPGFVVVANGQLKGLLTYQVAHGDCQVITVDSLVEGHGIGTALLETVLALAHSKGCRRVWLITTNDNTAAIRFYQQRGFELVTIHRKAVNESRKLKPSIPERGIGGIPIRDEIELERRIHEEPGSTDAGDAQ